jgi:hypothetical protein
VRYAELAAADAKKNETDHMIVCVVAVSIRVRRARR